MKSFLQFIRRFYSFVLKQNNKNCSRYLFEILAILFAKSTFVVVDQFVLIFLAFDPVKAGTDKVGCYSTLRTCTRKHVILL